VLRFFCQLEKSSFKICDYLIYKNTLLIIKQVPFFKEQDIDWDLFPSCLRPSTKRTIEKKTPKKSKQKEIGSILSKLEKKDEEGM